MDIGEAIVGEMSGVAVGADAVTDKAQVKKAQQQLHALALAVGNPTLDPYSAKTKDDGVIGPDTRRAVTEFNKLYGWPDDGATITAGTLEALKRPDVVNAAAAKAEAAKAAAAAATTAAQVQIAATQTTAAAASAPPEVQAQAAAAQAKAAQAKTPAEVAAAKVEVQAAAAAAASAAQPSFLTQKLGPLPVWGWGLGVGALTGGFFIIRSLLRRK